MALYDLRWQPLTGGSVFLLLRFAAVAGDVVTILFAEKFEQFFVRLLHGFVRLKKGRGEGNERKGKREGEREGERERERGRERSRT